MAQATRRRMNIESELKVKVVAYSKVLLERSSAGQTNVKKLTSRRRLLKRRFEALTSRLEGKGVTASLLELPLLSPRIRTDSGWGHLQAPAASSQGKNRRHPLQKNSTDRDAAEQRTPFVSLGTRTWTIRQPSLQPVTVPTELSRL